MNILQESPTNLRRRSKTLRIAFICTTVSGVAKYRMGSFAWQMRKFQNVETVLWPYAHNITLQNPWQVDILSRRDLWDTIDGLCEKADVVVWQALDFTHSLDLWQSMRERHQKPFLMEIDDYIADIPTANEAYQQYKAGSVRYQVAISQMRMSDALIVSTPHLAKFYEKEIEKIYVVPNSIDFTEWKGLERKKHARLRIGWIGGGTHGRDLEMVAPAIENILHRYKDVWFYCIHGCPAIYKSWAKVYHTTKWAPINLYPRHVASYCFDIGIAPLEDNNFNRGKSNLRWLEYSALKVPTVASPLPDFTRVIDGQNGMIADTTENWEEKLSMLIEDEEARKKMGDKAFETIKKDFNVISTANHYRHILQEFI